MRNPQLQLSQTLSICLMIVALYASGAATAETTDHMTGSNTGSVTSRSPDKTSGRMLGGWTAFLVGGAAAGPIGAIVAGLGGAWVGGEIQDASGHSGQLHQIKTDNGQTLTLRSPQQTFALGERVIIDGNRPRAVTANQ